MQTKTILGLSANTRIVSLAVIQGMSLEHYQTSLYKGIFNEAKKERILSRLAKLIAIHRIKEVAICQPYERHSTQNIKSLLETITLYLESQKIAVCSYPPQTFYHFYEEGKSKKAKKVMMEEVSNLYPELQRLFQRELRSKNKYYVRLFEAVGLAHIHSLPKIQLLKDSKRN